MNHPQILGESGLTRNLGLGASFVMKVAVTPVFMLHSILLKCSTTELCKVGVTEAKVALHFGFTCS